MTESIRVFSPATVANVGSAFDILGFALNEPGDTVIARRAGDRSIRVKRVESPYGEIPADPARNTAAVAANEVLRRTESQSGIELELIKNMPLGSGLGSSAASAAAGAFAANMLLGAGLSMTELVECAMEGERVACGTAHADNVAPSLIGGLVLIRSYSPLDLVFIDAPDSLYCSVVCPRVEVRTEDARMVLRKEVRLKDAVTQMGNVGGLIAGMIRGDLALIGRSLKDVLIEPERAALIPCFEEARVAAVGAGALGFGISGSGPSLFSFSGSSSAASGICLAIADVFACAGIECLTFNSLISPCGARIEE